jgi:hypothetical protein
MAKDLPKGYRWATELETEYFDKIDGAIVVSRTEDSNGQPYTQQEADIAVPIRKFADVAGPTVLMADYIPSHDETHDLADEIGAKLDEFRDYVASVRDEDQAADAVRELLEAFLREAPGS